MKVVSSKLILALSLPLATGLATSCTDYNYLDEEGIKELVTLEEYNRNFTDRYGEVDPNHDWGFGDIKGDGDTRAQVANKNEWVEKYHLNVPGWPDTYYKSDGTFVGLANGAKYHNSQTSTNTYDDTQGNLPAGDITDEEVQYVACWFRTHRNPGSTEIHWSDFYIQEVCSDIDRDATGKAINYGAEYEKKNGAWEHHPFTLNGWGIDQLMVKTIDGNTTHTEVAGFQGVGYDHIYNFNSGGSDNLENIETVPMDMNNPWGAKNCNLDAANNYKSAGVFAGKTDKRLIAFYANSGTEDFMAHYSNDEKWRSNFQDKNIWVVVHLHFTGASGRVYDGYYLGFDYAFYKEMDFDVDGKCTKYQVITPDGYYSNWIVKIAPGTPITTTTETAGFSRRIMCEDLGNTFDLDFDDIVFDVTYNLTDTELQNYKQSNSTADVDVTINLQAAGGTMPISVGKALASNGTGTYEAHRLFGLGDDYTTPVNVADGASAPVANYHITVNSVDPDDIPIYVYNTKEGNLFTLSKANNARNHYNTSVKTSNVPQKFAVPTSVLWLKETHQIETGYQFFASWVRNASFINNGKAWYDDENITNAGKTHLCGLRGYYSTTITTHTTNNVTGCTVNDNNAPAKLEYLLNTTTSNADWGIVTAPQFVEAGKKATITATPKGDYTFSQWSDGDKNATRTVTVNTLTNLMAYFKAAAGAQYYTVTLQGDHTTPVFTGEAQAIGTDGYLADFDNRRFYNAQIKLNCTVEEGYIFTGWYIKNQKVGENTNFELNISENGYHENLTVIAKAAKKCTIPCSVEIYDVDGTTKITDNPWNSGCKIMFDYWPTFGDDQNSMSGTFEGYLGQQKTYTITVGTGYELMSCSLSDPAETSGTFTVAEGMSITVKFRKKETFSVSVQIETVDTDGSTIENAAGNYITINGTACHNDDAVNGLYKNDPVSYAVVTDAEYEFVGFTHEGAQNAPSNAQFNITQNETMKLKFKKKATTPTE